MLFRLAAGCTAVLVMAACSETAPTTPPVVGPTGSQPHPDNLNPPNSIGPISTAFSVEAPRIINNGTIQLGVLQGGNLGVAGGTPSSGTSSTTNVGLRFMPTNSDATAPGCICEGWGVADAVTGVWGGANVARGGNTNITVERYQATDSTAISTVRVGNTFRVTHSYRPSRATRNLYEVEVTVENISANPVNLRYRRVIDWDIAPNTFSEFVTMQGTVAAENVLYANNNGFAGPNPLSSPTAGGAGIVTGDFVDNGPFDQGALLNFGFGTLAPGATRTFLTFYGATSTQAAARAALAAVGAEVYSFGQANYDGSGWEPVPGRSAPRGDAGRLEGVPHTFIFAFAGVGGEVIIRPPTAEPGGPYAAQVGRSVSFDGTASAAFDGKTITSYLWNFGDGTTATGARPTHTYTAPGTYTIRLTVADSEGLTGTATTTAVITPEPPSEVAVQIDIEQPGSPARTINLTIKHQGLSQLAIVTIFGAANLNVNNINVASLRLGDGTDPDTPPNRWTNGNLMYEWADVNGDGRRDLRVAFCICDLGLPTATPTTSEMVLRGTLNDGTAFRGSRVVNVVGTAP